MAKIYREQALLLFLIILFIAPGLQAQLNIALNLSNPACGGFATGSIEAIPLNGQQPYTYEWSNGETGNPLENIPAGTYTVTVTDFNDETGTATGTLTEPPELFVEIVVTECSLPGEMLAAVTGGIMPYTYEWSTGEATPSISNLSTGLYCVTVTDINSCAFQTCESIGTLLSLTVETDSAFCGSGIGGTAIVDVTGGVWPFEYEWNTGQTTDTITDLPPGIYEVTVTADNGCTETEAGEVFLGPGTYDIDFDNNNPGCSGSNTGSVTAIASGGFSPYIYVWSTGDTAATVNDLPAGTYYVTATDDFGCVSNDSTELITADSISIIAEAENPSCPGAANGSIQITASNGAPPYSYLWNTGDTTATLTGLSPGIYIVSVTDTLNCLAVDTSVLAAPLLMELSVSSTDESECGAHDGTASVDVLTGGASPLSYLWSNGDTTSSINGLSSGIYYITVTDANDCSAVDSTEVDAPVTLNVSITGTEKVCPGANNGELTAEVGNGTAPFSFEWSNGATTPTIGNLPAGTYSISVTSNEGCTGSASATIETNPPLTISENVTNVSCYGFSNGAISVSIGGGTSPLSILWENGSNSTIRNNLSAGNYSLTVTDAIGCTLARNISVEQPDELEVEFDSSGGSCGSNGFVIALANGGTPPYSYLWENGQSTAFLNNLPPGNYTVTVTDAHNCTRAETANVPPYPPINLTVSATDTNCNGTGDGTASANPTGGNPPFSYLWSNGQTSQTITQLVPGTYSVTVTSATGCTATGSAQVHFGADLSILIEGAQYICPGTSGTLTAVPLGGTPPFNYQWSNGATSPNIGNLGPGTWSVSVADATGCTGEASVTLANGGNFTVNNFIEHVDCFGENTGRIQLSVINGIPPYQFSWSNGATTANIDQLAAGTYTVTVADATACTQTLDYFINQPPLLEVTTTGTDGTCGNLGSVSSSVTGGTAPYFYMWSNGQTNPDIILLTAGGTYTLTVTDAKGCTAVSSATIEVIPSLSCNIMLVQPVSTIFGNDGQLTALPVGGIGPFSYSWSNGQTTETITNLFADNYAVTMTDAAGCMTTCNFALLDGARIGDFVWKDANENGIQDAGESGLANVAIELEGTDNYGNIVSKSTSSGPQGEYRFDVVPGNYRVAFNVPNGFLPSPAFQGSDDNLDSDADPLTHKTPVFAVFGSMDKTDIDAGFFEENNCNNLTSAGTICCDQTLCSPTQLPATITNQTGPEGGSGTVEYLWMRTDQPGPFDPNTWTAIPNSNSPDWTPQPLTTTTWFVRRARRSGCAGYLVSNIIEISVNNLPSPEITGPDTVCTGSINNFTTTDLGSNASYAWTFPGATPGMASTRSAAGITWETPGNRTISVEVSVSGCLLTASAPVSVVDDPNRCGFDLLLQGQLTDSLTVLLDWLYPPDTSILRTYLVQWSAQGLPFVTLGAPDSTAQSGNLIHYFFTHNNPSPGLNAYRVLLNESTGNQLISNVVEILNDTTGQGEYYLVHSFPNPFSDKITVRVYDRFDGLPISVELFNSLGQSVFWADIPDNADDYEINTSRLVRGTYFLFVRYGGKPQKIFKMVK